MSSESPSFFALDNLVSSSTSPCTPWLFTGTVPEEVKGKQGKKARDKWINHPSTRWQVYSAIEGTNANGRVTDPKGVDEGNPPIKIHAFIADIDATVSEDELAAGIARLGSLVPNYYEKTLSGNARLIWLFEKPVLVPNSRFATEFLKLALAKGRFDQVAAALDKPAWESPNRYYTNSGEWRQIDPTARVPSSLLQGWVLETAEHHHWRKDRGALEIPLPIVWTELQKKYPTAASWPGDFVAEAQGPAFWVQGSESPKAAIVKTTGLYTFSAHAIKPFYSWADLLGKAFVDDYAARLLGKAVEDIYHDGRAYWRKDGHGDWKPFSKEDIVLHLSTDRGLSSVKDAGMPSEVSRALAYIQNWHGIIGAAPFAFAPSGPIVKNGAKILNTHTRRVLTPATEKGVWGPEGNFPFLSKFLDGFFHPESKPGNPLLYQMAWLARTYKGAYNLCLDSGQNQLLLGAPGVGKSFWNQFVIPMLLGGSAEAQQFLTGQSKFNSQLFQFGFWTVDDNTVVIDAKTRAFWSAMLKRMAANHDFELEEKFRVACSVEWRGRVSVTANSDELSATIIPDLSISIADKLSIYRTADVAPVVFPERRELVALVKAELPYFARWLLDFECPPELVGTARFGVKAYHEESLMRTAEQSSSTSGFQQIVDDWRHTYFDEHPSEKAWSGTALQMLKAMHVDEQLAAAALKGISMKHVDSNLAALKLKGVSWISSEDQVHRRVWTIQRPELAQIQPLPFAK